MKYKPDYPTPDPLGSEWLDPLGVCEARPAVGFFGSGGDPLFPAVSLLLHGDGANSGTVITDSSKYARTATQSGTSGNVVTSTSNPKYGTAALQFGGTQSLSYSSSSQFEIASRDFTVECWANLNMSLGSGKRHLWQLYGTDINNRVNITIDSATNKVELYTIVGSGSGTIWLSSSTTVVPTVWVHIAFVKYLTTAVVYINGVSAGTVSPNFPTGNMGFCLGTQNYSPLSSDWFAGQLDEVRVTAGYARYTNSFIPQNAAFPNY